MKITVPSAAAFSFTAKSLTATQSLAQELAGLADKGDVIALRGDLGMGKSAFARAFIQARAGAPIEVPSPTFTLVQTYELPSGLISHFDLYRLNDAADAYELGFDDAFGGITLIEWPDRLGDGLPRDPLIITFAPADAADARKISLEGGPSWAGRLDFLRLKF